MLFGTPLRFRYNFLCLKLFDISSMEILQWLRRLFNLEFTLEQSGFNLRVLEAKVSWETRKYINFFSNFKLAWGPLHDKTPPREEMVKKSWVHPLSCNARHMLKSYVPSAVIKCALYSLSLEQATLNVEKLKIMLNEKGYPGNWWRAIVARTWCKVKKGIG